MMRTADCYVQAIDVKDDNHVVVHVFPLGHKCCYGNWQGHEPDEGKEILWEFDVAKLGLLKFIEFYVSYRVWALDQKIPNSKYHEIFVFDDQGQILGISKN